MGFSIDHHLVAGITISGMVLDVLGGLFLAYDLLGGEKGPLRTLTKVITYGIAGVSLGLLGATIGWFVANQFHLNILATLGRYGSLGVLLGYTSGWGFAVALGYVFISSRVPSTSSPMLLQWLEKADECAVWLVVGLAYWLRGKAFVVSHHAQELLIWQRTRKPIALQQEPEKCRRKVDRLTVSSSILASTFLPQTRRFRTASAFEIGGVEGVLFLLGSIVTLDFHLVSGLPSGLVAGLAAGLLEGFPFGVYVRRLLVLTSDTESEVKPAFDTFGFVLGLIVTIMTASLYAVAFWLLFGGNVLIILLGGSFVGFIGGLGGGFVICVTPRIEWEVRHLPPRRMGYIGAILILIGFVIQSLQYWIILFDIHVN